MSLSVGIVGLPNVGKSTLFQALTKKEVNIANYPFATIDPNVGVVEVPDERLQKLAALFHSQKIIPTVIEFVDIAGLVRGANKGEGLGNQFLTHIREVSAIVEVVRCFENPDIIHVEESVDPLRDIDTIHTELLLKDLETVEKRLLSLEKEARGGKKEAIAQNQILQDAKKFFEQGVRATEYQRSHPESEPVFHELQLLTAKPIIFLLNSKNQDIPLELKQNIEKAHGSFVAVNLQEELEIAGLSDNERQELGMQSNLSELIQRAYEILNLITFFTTGPDETRAWTIVRGAKAPQAGGVIHSDFEKNFIRAAVIQWDALLEAGGLAEAMAEGLIRTEGKEYVVRDGDVIEIKHG
ncbi:MAG: redox-regulated ATPase YchF [Candidatus Wildermuthbacteria bacterium]|nr:redox-regulated ATPase YchF [Candidatus Wildermuthbacteria bacterium]